MVIIERGAVPDNTRPVDDGRLWTGSCRKCKSKIEAAYAELKFHFVCGEWVAGGNCPVCHEVMIFRVSEVPIDGQVEVESSGTGGSSDGCGSTDIPDCGQ